MLSFEEHLIACLSEECGEISKECCKALRFGLDDKVTLDPNGPRGTEGPTNRDKIVAELNDLMGIVHKMVAFGIVPSDWQDRTAIGNKILRVNRFMEYSRRVGALEPEKD